MLYFLDKSHVPISRIDAMVSFHLPGDPYYPNQGNGGWIEDDQEEIMEKEEEFKEGMQEDSDSDPEDNNLPLVAPIQNPNPRLGFQGSTP